MRYLRALALSLCVYLIAPTSAGETVLSTVITPDAKKLTVTPQKFTLQRQARSYYDQRLGPRPPYERLEYERPSRCGRCDDRYTDERDYDRPRYDDDRRQRPTYGNRYDRNREEDRFDRRNDRKNGTEESDEDKKPLDDKDDRRNPNRGNNKDRERNRYDDRDRYRPDYYDRFLRPAYDDPRDPYRERRPYRDPYERFDDGYGAAGRYDQGYRRQVYDDRFDRGNGYDDTGYGSYSPGLGRGPHDSFRPWDETYRGQSGWDEGGRGYYFAGGRPEAGAGGWARPAADYYGDRDAGWQNVGYSGGYRDRAGTQDRGYQDYQDPYQRPAPAGWHNVNERRPYRDQTGVNQIDYRGDNRGVNRQPTRNDPTYAQNGGYSQNGGGGYSQTGTYGQPTYGNTNRVQPANNAPTSSTTTPGNSYLYEREDATVTGKDSADATTKSPS